MVQPHEPSSGGPGLSEMIQKMTGWPSPEKILSELQRLNNNLECLQPDIHKLAAFLTGSGGADLQNLTAALNKIDMENVIKVINDFNNTTKSISEKLWPKR